MGASVSSWAEVATFIRANYKVLVDEPHHLGLVFETGGLRTQVVHLWHQTLADGAEEWMQIESPIMRLNGHSLEGLLRETGNMVCGGAAITGDFVIFRHSVPLSNVDINEVTRPLALVTTSADRLEMIFTGGQDDF
jgi:hypothetical protein